MPLSCQQLTQQACRYVAVTLSKVELILNVLSLGVSVAWIDTDVVHFGNALPYMQQLDLDIALSNENCRVHASFHPQLWNRSAEFNQNTGMVSLPPHMPWVKCLLAQSDCAPRHCAQCKLSDAALWGSAPWCSAALCAQGCPTGRARRVCSGLCTTG